MVTERTITVEVIYATEYRCYTAKLTVPVGSTAREIIDQFGAAQGLRALHEHKVGVYSRLIDPDDVVADGDRLEIYRPLVADPKTVRRQLARDGKTMGRKKTEG